MEEKFVDNDGVDIGRLTRYLFMQSKLILGIFVLFTSISLGYYFTATKYYKVTSLLQVESSNTNIFDPTNTLNLNPSASSDGINLIALYKSRTNMIKLIEDLNLNIKIKDLNKNEDIGISIEPIIQTSSFQLNLKVKQKDDRYDLYIDDRLVLENSIFNTQYALDDIKINIEYINLQSNRVIELTYRTPDRLYNSTKNSISINSKTKNNNWFRQEGLFEISHVTEDVDKGIEIINYANDVFLDYRISVETEKARKAISFIDKNISSLREVVNKNKIKLKDFREKNKSINVDLEIQAVIEKIQSIENSLYDVEVELSNASDIYTSNNPIYLNLINKKEVLKSQKDEILLQVNSLPKEQQEYIDLYNEVEISQSLFEELENRRLGFSILEASTIGNIRIIDTAYKSSLVSPKFSIVVLAAILSLLLGFVIAMVRGLNFLPITNPAELIDNNIDFTIAGVIPRSDSFDLNSDNHHFNGSIESLIVNIKSIQDDDLSKKLISISSPSPSNGKSTIASTLAAGLAKLNHKVLLIDNDLKKGALHKIYNTKPIRKDTFFSINETNFEDIKVEDNLFFVPRVKNLLNSFQYVCSKEFELKLNFFKEHFDFIIFDTAPILSVADTPIIIKKSDLNLLVVRHSVNRINEIKQTVHNYEQINKNIDGIIYNAYAKPNSYYGYYSLYGNYSYQYYAEKYLDDAYEYKNDA